MKANKLVYFLLGLMIVQSVAASVGPATARYDFDNTDSDYALNYGLTDVGSGNNFSTTAKLGSHSADFSGSGGKKSLYSSTRSDADYQVSWTAWIAWDTTPTTDWRTIADYGRDNANCGTDGGTSLTVAFNGGATDELRLFSSCGGSAAYGFTPTVGQWYHVAAVYEGNKSALLYLNGTNVLNYTFTPNGGGGAMKLNCNSGLSCYFAVGQTGFDTNPIQDSRIDDVRFYMNESLNATQILEIYNEGAGTRYNPIP